MINERNNILLSDSDSHIVFSKRENCRRIQFGQNLPTLHPTVRHIFEGDFYTARAALENLVKSAKHRVIIIDGYVSALTLDILDVRSKGVKAVIYTSGVGTGMQRLMQEHDRMFPNPEAHIDIRKWNKQSHDRWLIIDDRLYHCGHSLNANGGHKMSAITLMGTSPEVILGEMV